VVSGATSFIVTTSSGNRHPAKLVGSFPADDLAVIKVSGANLKPATFADSSKLNVGDLAIAIGNPFGLRSSVTEGFASAFRQAVQEGGGDVTLPAVIQTSAAINPHQNGAKATLQAPLGTLPGGDEGSPHQLALTRHAFPLTKSGVRHQDPS
jgi:putative serine protease PepD